MDTELRRSLTLLQNAECSVVLWFAEMTQRKPFRELGYASIHQYADEVLGFSSNRTYRYLHLVAELERLPLLRAALAAGEIGWTKAREVAKVASAETEERWLELARRSSRRELEQKVADARLRAAARRKADPAQGVLSPGSTGSPGSAAAPGSFSSRAGSVFPAGLASTAGSTSPAASPCPAGSASTATSPCPAGSASTATSPCPAGSASTATSPCPAGSASTGTPNTTARSLACDPEAPLIDDAPVAVVFRLTPLQLARYESLMERIRKARVLAPDSPREEILLAALEDALARAGRSGRGREEARERQEATIPSTSADADGRGPRVDGGGRSPEASENDRGPDVDRAVLHLLPRGNSTTDYKIIVYKCAHCQQAVVQTQHGPKGIAPQQLSAIGCDAVIQRPGERNRAAIPPAVRGAVLARDHHRCRARGCHNTHFLEVHHIVPREHGGTNQVENLVTLCSSCHRLWHERALDERLLERSSG